MDLALATRAGLPDALRALVEQYPRAGWERHPEFNALTRFWLDRHLMFRRLQGLLLTETVGFLDRGRDPQRFGADLARHGGMFLNELHGHHLVEDAHYFPTLRAQDPRLVAGFDLLDADHHALDGGIQALAASMNGVLRGLADDTRALEPAAALKAELDAFARALDRHLTDEEDLVVPVILEHRGAGLA